jgi:thiol-disulfide isomerase/thioredoxin
MKKIIFLFSIILAASCGNSKEEESLNENSEINDLEINVEISGQITGANNQTITLEALSGQGTIKLAETQTKQDGKFSLKGNIQGMGLYQMKIGEQGTKIIPLTLEPNDKIKLKAEFATFERLPVLSGASWAPIVTKYMSIFNDFALGQMKMMEDNTASEEEQIKKFLELRKPLDNYAREQMDKDPGNPANIVLSTSLTPAMGFDNWDAKNLETFKRVAFAYEEKYKDSPIAMSMSLQVNQIEAGYNEYMSFKSGTKEAPEIELKNPDGKVIKLSSLRGKVVLIDFWASWCGPCRQENPNLVKIYNQYKNKGFTIYSVSLDRDLESWKRAIESDGLVWPNHVSDLLHWNTPMTQLYGFQSIPFTVLVNKQGKIIGTNLRGTSLEQKLKEVLK